MPNLGLPEIALIVLAIFLLFGATRLPKLCKSIGQSIRWFKTGLHEDLPDDDEKPAKSEAAKLEKGDETDKS